MNDMAVITAVENVVDAVLSASASITRNSNANVASILLALLKPWSIICRTASGRLNVAVDEAASATSQAANKPFWRMTNGHSARSEPMRGFAFTGS